MNESELKAIFEQLEAQGWQPMWCDAEIPSYDRSVPCGDPTIVYEDAPGSFSLPRKMLSMYPEFTVNVTGESMADVGVATGDTLRVICDDSQQDGDIVLASIDEELTVKVYCVDEDGNPWLVPQNKGFKPISLKDKTNVRIIGRVSMIIKNSPRVAYRECMNIIRKAKREMMERQGITPEQKEVNYKSDDGDNIVTQLLPIFYNKEKDVRLFLNQIRGMATEDITELVNQWVKEKRISDYGNSRKGVLWGILHNAGLYTRTVQNWNRRVD
jgi:hypothetical protein